MEIVAALFIENINVRQLFEGGPTRIDLSGIHFSLPAPEPVPVTITPHLVVLVRCPADHSGQGTLETSFRDASGKEVARNAQPLQVEPGGYIRVPDGPGLGIEVDLPMMRKLAES